MINLLCYHDLVSGIINKVKYQLFIKLFVLRLIFILFYYSLKPLILCIDIKLNLVLHYLISYSKCFFDIKK